MSAVARRTQARSAGGHSSGQRVVGEDPQYFGNVVSWLAPIAAASFGIIHGTDRDQGRLVLDLIEEHRAPFGDRAVRGMLGRGFTLELDKEGL